MDERLILVTGATGALGPTVVNQLAASGYRVRGLALQEPPAALKAKLNDWLTGDICDQYLIDAAMRDVTHVVHMAALLHISNPAQHLYAEYERVNVQGTATVVEAARCAGVRRLVFLSTIAVYGAGMGGLLNESSSVMPDTYYAKTKFAAERIVLSAAGPDGGPLGVVLRLASVYGSRVKGNYSRLVYALSQRRFVPIGSGGNRRTLIYDKDMANAVQAAIEHPRAAGQIYNVTDGETHSLHEIIEAICDGLGRPPPHIALPVAPIRLGLRIADGFSRIIKHPLPVSSTMLQRYLENVAVDGSKIMQELNFMPAYNLSFGWQDTIAEMRRSGVLPSAE